MPVGTGSINRAARSSKKTAEAVKSENVIAQAEEPSAEKKTTQKKTTAKTAAPKKTTSSPKPVVKKETEEKAPELRVYGNETVFVVGNECCHLTEELPVHLL